MSRLLLVCGASAALHKACDLASKLVQEGHVVRAVLTPRAARLVRPQLFEALTGQVCQITEWGRTRQGAMSHIELATWAEAAIVAPLSADLAARLACGLANDLASTACLALPAAVKRLACPAMNPHMHAAPAVQRNLEQLRRDGWTLLEPRDGHMACGVHGKGRLPEADEIQSELRRLLAPSAN
jgi:phosphopantothenoylcysteine decarboxylase/phosphopantothenate--cysteine ligase